MTSIVELLCKYVEYNDLENVQKLLDQGANPTQTATCGRTAIGIACLNKHVNVLELLLNACKNYGSVSHSGCDTGESEAKKWKRQDRDGNLEHTPDGMDDLQWEDEIEEPVLDPKVDTVDDEWSVLYRYYARIIETTSDLLANAITTVGSYECMELLLKHNAPINATISNGYTALHLAVEEPNLVELLLQYKANPNKLTFLDQMAPIHLATKVDAIQTIQLLKNAGAQVNITNGCGQSSLHLAAVYEKYDAAVKLIECGAKVNVQDEEGATPLFTAIVINDCRMVTMLLKNGGRLLPSQHLLSYTIRNEFRQMTKLLVEAGENVNGRDPIGWTPLLLAIHKRDITILEYLIANGAKVNENSYSLKELHVAVQQFEAIAPFKRIFSTLVRHGVEIDSLNRWGETPLCLAMLLEKYRFAEYLIHEGANVNAGSLIKARDCMLLVRECNNINLIKLFVNSGLKLIWSELMNIANKPNRHRITAANRATPSDSDESCEMYLMHILTNPLSLKQQARIVIRNRMIVNMKSNLFVRKFVLSHPKYQLSSALEMNSQNEITTNANTSLANSSRRIITTTHQTSSILECLIWQLDLPRCLHFYLYAFPDIPPMSESTQNITVFVND